VLELKYYNKKRIMKKEILIVLISTIVITGVVFLSDVTTDGSADLSGSQLREMEELIECFDENNLVIYGSEWCPACTSFVESLGGYDLVEPIYVECSDLGSDEEQERCLEEAKTNYVPEIQIDGEVYHGDIDPESLAEEVGC